MTDRTSPTCLCSAQARTMMRVPKPDFGLRKLYECETCGTAQFFPLPTAEDEIGNIYQSEDYLGNIREAEYKGYFTFFLNALTDKLGLKQSDKILDFGAGKCFYHKFFQEAGYENVSSLEINHSFVRFAQEKLNLTDVHSSTSDLVPASYDIVFSNQVFEHLVDPVAILNVQIMPLVKPGGMVVFAVPNWASWNRTLLGRRWVGYCPEDHIWFFSPRAVPHVFGNVAGLTVEDIFVGSSLGKSYDAYAPSGFIKQLYLRLFWRRIENWGKGDQMVVVLRKAEA